MSKTCFSASLALPIIQSCYPQTHARPHQMDSVLTQQLSRNEFNLRAFAFSEFIVQALKANHGTGLVLY